MDAMKMAAGEQERLWQRVSPGLEPFPRAWPEEAHGERALSREAPETLPGAVSDPCCMGSAARENLAVLEGFRDQEAVAGCSYQAMQRCAPAWAQRVLRELAGRKRAHSRYLGTLVYLVTGQCGGETADCRRIYVGNWCPALRQRYHEEACTGLNYLRAAEGTADLCLQRAYRRLSEESFQQAEWLTALLERALPPSCTGGGTGV